jgi:hypothetical protein
MYRLQTFNVLFSPGNVVSSPTNFKNSPMMEGVVPEAWKLSRITPLREIIPPINLETDIRTM